MSCISNLDYSSPAWNDLPLALRSEVRRMLEIFREAPETGLTRWLEVQAANLGVSYPTLRRKYYALRNNGGDWTHLIDNRRAKAVKHVHRARISLARSPRFIAHLIKLVENHKRKNRPAFRSLRMSWQAREKIIPGYENWPGWPQLPAGWTDRNLARIVEEGTNAARMASIRVGTSSKTNPFLPTVLTTRAGLWPGAIIQLDDVFHDNLVTLGRKREIVRVMELGALDVFSACRFHFGAKPRRRTESGGWENIRSADMRMFIAGMLHTSGYSPHGTMFMSEHNTAKISEDIARILYDSTGGMIRVDYQPIEGKQAALCGFWNGTEGGNFRAKACLESTHNRMHNDLAALPMQTGSPSSGITGPVTTERIAKYIDGIIRDVLKKSPHHLDTLRLPTIDFHAQFWPFLVDYYEFGLNGRTDHNLEAWEKLGHVVTEYTLAPGSGEFVPESRILTLPQESQIIFRDAVRMDPAAWSRRRKLSPMEVWKRREKFLPIPQAVLCEILGQDLAREVRSDRGYLTFSDLEICSEPLSYTARYCSGPYAGNEIRHGEKVAMLVMPFDDSTAMIIDAHGRFMGEVPLYNRVLPIDPSAFGSTAPFDSRPDIRSADLTRAAGEKHSRIADILEPTRILHREEVREARDLREHNRRVISGEPLTDPERRSAAAMQGQRSAAANRLQSHGSAFDDGDYSPAAAPSAFDSLGEEEDLPEAL